MYAIVTCALLELVLREPAYRKMLTLVPARTQDQGPYKEPGFRTL